MIQILVDMSAPALLPFMFTVLEAICFDLLEIKLHSKISTFAIQIKLQSNSTTHLQVYNFKTRNWFFDIRGSKLSHSLRNPIHFIFRNKNTH